MLRNGLIETWDVLKFYLFKDACRRAVINRNMGCIEISTKQPAGVVVKINRNMGCIEITFASLLFRFEKQINRNMGCIEILQH